MAKNVFDMFSTSETHTAEIKALNGAKVTYRYLTMAEQDAFSKRLVKDFGADGSKPIIDFEEATKIKYEKAALILVEPKMSVKDLMALSSNAVEAINEINALIEGEDEGVDEEGNSKD
jgi:hypothetical protein